MKRTKTIIKKNKKQTKTGKTQKQKQKQSVNVNVHNEKFKFVIFPQTIHFNICIIYVLYYINAIIKIIICFFK